MKLKDFKEGDIIHRTTSIKKCNRSFNDRSFIESPIIFLGIKSNLFFHIYFNEIGLDDVSYTEVDWFNDDNWDYFPVTFWAKLKCKYFKKHD